MKQPLLWKVKRGRGIGQDCDSLGRKVLQTGIRAKLEKRIMAGPEDCTLGGSTMARKECLIHSRCPQKGEETGLCPDEQGRATGVL